MDTEKEDALRTAEKKLEALELEMERAHRVLDQHQVPREFRASADRDPLEYSLEGRLRLLLDS